MANKRGRSEENSGEMGKLAKTLSFGVCTRAKSMALKGSMASSPTTMMTTVVDDGCYLHLRSRRLERYPPLPRKKRSCDFDVDEKENVGVIKFEERCKAKGKVAFKENIEGENRMMETQENEFKRDETNRNGFVEEAQDSFGENDLEFDQRERESTPSRLIMGRDRDEIKSPASTNKPTSIIRIQSLNPITPTLQDLEDFFNHAETHRIHNFTNKYNFDLLEEKPFKGRFQWVKIKP